MPFRAELIILVFHAKFLVNLALGNLENWGFNFKVDTGPPGRRENEANIAGSIPGEYRYTMASLEANSKGLAMYFKIMGRNRFDEEWTKIK